MIKNRIFYFNPTCELAVANGSFSYVPPLLLQEMERDLATLPFIFSDEHDFVLTDNPPSDQFLATLAGSGFSLPRFYNLSELEGMSAGSFGAICPWGWSPAAHRKLKNLKIKCSYKFQQSPASEWLPQHRQLYERATALKLLNRILEEHPESWLIPPEMTGIRVSTVEEIESLPANQSPLVLKAPLSSSGRGIQIIRKKLLNTANRQWISGVLKQQGYLIAEPYLEKLTDLSFQFRILPDLEIEYLSPSFFETNTNGQYNGTLIRPDLEKSAPDADMVMVETTANRIQEALKNSDYARYYRGFLGVDALIFRHNKQLLMQPCLEVNCRMNMGILGLLLEKKIHPEASGKFELFYGNAGRFRDFAAEQSIIKPPIIKDGKLRSGFLPLTEPGRDKKFGAYISLDDAR